MHGPTHDDPEQTRHEIRQRARELRDLRQAERELALHHPDELMRIQERGPDLNGTPAVQGRVDGLPDTEPVAEPHPAGDGDLEVVDDLTTDIPGVQPLDDLDPL